jgi:hypothetical protein
LGQTLLVYHLQPGCDVVKAAGLHGGAGQLVRNGAAAAGPNLATDEILKKPEVKPLQNVGNAGPQWKTCIECKHSKRVGDFARVTSSKDKRSDACRACLAALRGRRSGRELDHLQLTVEEAWKRAKICKTCNEEKELRDASGDCPFHGFHWFRRLFSQISLVHVNQAFEVDPNPGLTPSGTTPNKRKGRFAHSNF